MNDKQRRAATLADQVARAEQNQRLLDRGAIKRVMRLLDRTYGAYGTGQSMAAAYAQETLTALDQQLELESNEYSEQMRREARERMKGGR